MLCQYFTDLFGRSRKAAEIGFHDVVSQRQVKVADGAHHSRMGTGLQASRVPGHDHRQTATFVRIGFGVLVRVQEAGVIQHGAVAFGNRFEFGQEVGEFFGVPAGDVAEDALSAGSDSEAA